MVMTEQYDLIVIGSGPGGYVAALRGAQLGLKTACIEKADRPGGVCLNVGCIPSKALLDSSEYFHLAKTHFRDHGIMVETVGLDLATMMRRKEKVIDALTTSVAGLLKGNKVDLVKGQARIVAPDRVKVTGDDGKDVRELTATSILVATGSAPVTLPGIPLNGKNIVDSTGALAFDVVPEHLAIIGGGYIGLELGSVWNRLGAKVSVIEMLPHITPMLDGQVSRALLRILKQQGLTFHLKTRVDAVETQAEQVQLTLATEDGVQKELRVSHVLVAIGRHPLTEGLGLTDMGVALDRQSGHIKVNGSYQTTVPSVYAIGDVIKGPALAHKASAEGIAAVEGIAGIASEVNYDALPAIIYTAPEIASVGLTEETVKERKIPYCTGSYPFSGAGRARCMGETDGFVKLIAHGKTDRILGCHIIGPRASDMIAECVLAMEFGASSEDIAKTIHGHPTFSEALQEAAKAVQHCSIYAG